MKLPRRRIEEWAKELIDSCSESRPQRINDGRMWSNFYYTGNEDGSQATYNKVYSHVDRLASYLFSPTDLRYAVEYERTNDAAAHGMGEAAASALSREFHRRDVDLALSSAVEWGLVKGSAFVKLMWGRDGFDPYVVQPEMMGVLREDLNGLDRQEAFFHSIYLTLSSFRNLIRGHPEEEDIMRRVARGMPPSGEGDEPGEDSMLKQVVIGGINPVTTDASAGSSMGRVNWMSAPRPVLPAKVMTDLVRLDELWVLDDDREDWTTIQLANREIAIEGKLQRRNLLGVEGRHPFVQVCPNTTPGYFWGMSEILQIALLQISLNARMNGIQHVLRLQERPPHVLIGGTATASEAMKALSTPDGFLTESTPNAKLENVAPKMPDNAFQELGAVIGLMDELAGMPAIMRGEGEQGVRAGVHADTLTRSAGARLRDRALVVERQAADAGDLGLSILQAKWAYSLGFDADGKPGEFLLEQLPDDYRVSVDSHSASPAFAQDSLQLIFALAKAGAISPIDLLKLTPVPSRDTLIMEAKKRAAQQAALMAEAAKNDPKALLKGSRRR